MVDVLVIGGGLAGWRAAEAAVAAGRSVTLVANGVGNSPEIHALNVPVGPGDSVELFIADTLKSGQGACDPALVEVLCRESVKLADEFPFDRNADGSYKMIQPLGCSVPRCVSIDHKIGAWALARIKRALAGKVEVMQGRVTALEAGGAGAGRAGNVGGGAGAGRAGNMGGGAGAGRAGNVCGAAGSNVCGAPRAAISSPHPFFPGRDYFMLSLVNVSQGERVDYWELPNCVYHVCFRLADSVALSVRRAWSDEREELEMRRRGEGPPLSVEEYRSLLGLLSEKIGRYLDAGNGSCLLARVGVADRLRDTIFHDEGLGYVVHAVGIMPNHVHVIVQPLEGFRLREIVEQWKRISAHAINKALERSGQVWMGDFYNRIIRDADEYANQVEYVFGNDMVWAWKRSGPARGAPETCGVVPARGAPETCGVVPARGGPETFAARLAPRGGTFAARLAPHKGTKERCLFARSVVIATGGWCGKYDFSDNPPELRGDGIALAQSLGAAVRDLDAVQYEPTVALAPARLRGIPVITTMLHEGATFRNRLGAEFLPDKHANKDTISRAIRAEIAAGRGVPARGAPETCGVWYDATGVPREILETRYADTVRRYAACGIDITREPMLVAPAPHTSLGGVVIDADCRVLRADGTPIPGLFAAGEVTGGVHGRNRLGGNAGTEVLVFGKIAGALAARHGNLYAARN